MITEPDAPVSPPAVAQDAAPPAIDEAMSFTDYCAGLPAKERPDAIAVGVLSRRGELRAAEWQAALSKFRTERI